MEIADIQNVVGILVDPLGRKAGDLNFWDQSATDFFTAVILHVLYSEPDEGKNLAQVRRLLINIEPTLHAMMNTQHRLRPDHHAADGLARDECGELIRAGREPLPARGPGVGQPHRLGRRPGEELAPGRLRRDRARGPGAGRLHLPVQQHPRRDLCRADRQIRPPGADRAGGPRLHALDRRDRLLPGRLGEAARGPRASIRSSSATTGPAPTASSPGRRSASSTTTPRPTIPSPTPAARRSTSRSSRSSQRSPNTYQVQWRETTYDQGVSSAHRELDRPVHHQDRPAEERGRAQGQSARHLHHRLPVESGAISLMRHSILRASRRPSLCVAARPGRRRRRLGPDAHGADAQPAPAARRRRRRPSPRSHRRRRRHASIASGAAGRSLRTVRRWPTATPAVAGLRHPRRLHQRDALLRLRGGPALHAQHQPAVPDRDHCCGPARS